MVINGLIPNFKVSIEAYGLGWPHPKVKNGEKIGAIVFLPLRTMLISFLAFKISPDIWKTSLWTSFFEHHLLFTLQQSHVHK